MKWSETLIWEKLRNQTDQSDRPGTDSVSTEIQQIINDK